MRWREFVIPPVGPALILWRFGSLVIPTARGSKAVRNEQAPQDPDRAGSIAAATVHTAAARWRGCEGEEEVVRFGSQDQSASAKAGGLAQIKRELAEALEQQAATSDVLQVISSSPGDLEPVFNAMLENATRICGAQYGMLWLTEGDGFRASAMVQRADGANRSTAARAVIYPGEDIPLGQLARTRQLVHIQDLKTEPGYINGFQPLIDLVEDGGARTHLLYRC